MTVLDITMIVYFNHKPIIMQKFEQRVMQLGAGKLGRVKLC